MEKNRNCLCYHCSGFHVLFDRNILSVKNGEGKHPVTLQWVVSDLSLIHILSLSRERLSRSVQSLDNLLIDVYKRQALKLIPCGHFCLCHRFR